MEKSAQGSCIHKKGNPGILKLTNLKMYLANCYIQMSRCTVTNKNNNKSFSYLYNYASTSLSCAGIQRWKSVSFRCWAAINLVGEMSNEEQDTPPPTLPTLFLPHCVKSSAWVIICVFHARLLQCRHTETLGVRLIYYFIYSSHLY